MRGAWNEEIDKRIWRDDVCYRGLPCRLRVRDYPFEPCGIRDSDIVSNGKVGAK